MKFVLFVTLIWSILDSGWSITDEEYIQFKAGLAEIQELRQRVDYLEGELSERMGHLEKACGVDSDAVGKDLVQNTTIEERVAILELQMAEVQEDMTVVHDDVEVLEDEMAFLFDEQVIQDERIYDLEQETTDLDTRVEVLEAGGGGGGNVTALEERVETLEGTAAEHEADIADLETRQTAAETQIEDLQATDAELDSRISDLEAGGGGGGASNQTAVAFRAAMNDTDNDDMPRYSTVMFSDVQLNEGNGYDPATGVFTAPPGGAGYYYFATHYTVSGEEYASFDIRVNDVWVCTVWDDNQDARDHSNAGCTAVIYLAEGDEVWNEITDGTDTTPLFDASYGIYNSFNGFRI